MKKSGVKLLLGIAACICSLVGLCDSIVEYLMGAEDVLREITLSSITFIFGGLLIAKTLKELRKAKE